MTRRDEAVDLIIQCARVVVEQGSDRRDRARLKDAIEQLDGIDAASPSPEAPPQGVCECGHLRSKHGPVYRSNALLYDAACWVIRQPDGSEYCGCNRYAPAHPSPDAGSAPTCPDCHHDWSWHIEPSQFPQVETGCRYEGCRCGRAPGEPGEAKR